MSDYFDTLSVLVLLSSILLMANKRIKSYIKTFRIQSVLITIAVGTLGIRSIAEHGRFDILIVCIVIFVLKVIYIPRSLNKMYSRVEYKVEKDFIFNIPILVLGCCGIVVLTYFSVLSIHDLSLGISKVQIVNALSVIFIGLFFMISRKKAIGQIIGFLVIENGLFITALFLTDGMPFIVDMGILVDLLSAVMILGVMVFRINEKFESIDLNKLNNLRG